VSRAIRILAPILMGVLFLATWDGIVRYWDIAPYILPRPILVAEALWTSGPSLLVSLWFTLKVTASALISATIVGGAIAILFSQSRILEVSLYPYAVALQVTPIVAIAPLIIIWVDDVYLAVRICAWIVAFFPIVANTTLGLRSADRNLAALFRLYGASRWQVLSYLQIPTALPSFLTGVRISGGLALIGAVVAEFVAGTGGAETGLAYRILESGYRLEIPRMFAALFLLSATGIVIYFTLDGISRWALSQWHESALPPEE
jgi:NitT/TauT family transport system permease protein